MYFWFKSKQILQNTQVVLKNLTLARLNIQKVKAISYSQRKSLTLFISVSFRSITEFNNKKLSGADKNCRSLR